MEFGISRGARTLAFAALALVATMVPPLPASAAEPVFTFSGGGYGHSVGMSQFGAYGMARDGYTWDEILTHYFTGASPATVDPLFSGDPVWINLVMEYASVTLTVRATGDEPAVPVTFTSGSKSLEAHEGDSVTVTRKLNGACSVAGAGDSFSGGCDIDITWDGWEDEPTTALVLAGCQSTNWNIPTGPQQQPCTYARGTLHVKPDNNTNTVLLTAEMDMEDYILGISESPYFWADTGGMAALQAQAVAARSYAYARMIARGDPADRPWCWCQLYDTTVDQNYVGWGHGAQSWKDAVAATADIVMTHPDFEVNGVSLPIETFYSSSTYGFTENSENAFTAALPYLVSVDDHWSGLPTTGNSNYRWNRTFSGSSLAAKLPWLTTVTAAEITECSNSGAALRITFQGSGGPRTFHVRDLRGLLGIPSQQIFAIGGSAPGEPACPSPDGDPGSSPTTTLTSEESTTTTTTVVAEPDDPALCLPDVSIKALIKKDRTLEKGMVGKDIRQLNRLLTVLGYYDAFIGKKFKKATVRAVKAFQRDHGLERTGIVDDTTRELLIEAHDMLLDARAVAASGDLAAGAYGPEVASLQSLLTLLGFDPGPADGAFGPLTTAALSEFERSGELADDGILDLGTKQALITALGLPIVDCPQG